MNEYEIEEARKKRKKAEQERDELMVMAYMAGNMGSVYMMDAATEFSSSGGYD